MSRGLIEECFTHYLRKSKVTFIRYEDEPILICDKFKPKHISKHYESSKPRLARIYEIQKYEDPELNHLILSQAYINLDPKCANANYVLRCINHLRPRFRSPGRSKWVKTDDMIDIILNALIKIPLSVDIFHNDIRIFKGREAIYIDIATNTYIDKRSMILKTDCLLNPFITRNVITDYHTLMSLLDVLNDEHKMYYSTYQICKELINSYCE